MIATARRCSAAFMVGLVAALFFMAAPPAYSEDTKAGSGQASDGSAQISVSVTYESVASGSDGGTTTSQTVTATVRPICYHRPLWTGKELADDIRSHNTSFYEDGNDPDAEYQGWRDHADDKEGHWYIPVCSGGGIRPDSSKEELDRAARSFFSTARSVFVPVGGEPPAPLIDGQTLARAAWDAVTIPQPSVETNPKVTTGDGVSGATVVGLDTWVWATGETPARVMATATAGAVTATVTAVSDGLNLSAPDSAPDCHGFGIPWTQGAAEGSSNCTVEFTRSSAHLGGTTPLTVSVGYDVAWTATDGTSGTLDPVTTTSTTDLPVAEIQTINRDTNH